MAREYGKVLMSAWNDKDFCALPRRAQGTYFFLTSQSDLNRAGVVTMALNRWASRCAENDKDVILDDLTTLARDRFIVVDEAEEEVLIRSYIRNDEGWKSPNVMVAVANAARQISSETLRSVIADELAKIDTSGLSTKVNETSGRSTREFIEGVIKDARKTLGKCAKDDDVMAWGTLRERVTERVKNEADSGRVTERVSSGFLTETETQTSPETKTSPETSTPAVAANDEDFDAFWNVYDKKEGRKAAHSKWLVAIKKPGVTAALLIRAASEYIAFQRSQGKHPEFTKLATTWLNGEHWTDERSARSPAPRAGISTTDERVKATLAIAERLRAQEQQDTQRQIGSNR